MRARDLAGPYPTVSADADALDAARLLIQERLPALLVLDRDDHPYAVVPSARVIGALLPWYMREGPIPTTVVDVHFDEEAREGMAGRSVTDWLPRGRITPAVVGPDAPPSQIAALMARKDTPIVAVVERNSDKATLIGAVTATALLEHIIGGS
ncbi:CBS domain-containing protein [Streptomyces luteolifulvus]|uniref:CBS domain-containing protein n=1 Tax=Streptomyces luteolifulvus TaxID=2615112 RepID=A0A6H9V901_9ACTN|nr:CBS domain-containing protein [Streptomyces luteolifulvus]KAB1149978.1 CBS domain-containing protein [Streptomyces luteolifulvus]